MINILKNNIKDKLNVIENANKYKLTEEQEEEMNINFIAYVKLYIKKVGIDVFLKETLGNTRYSFLLEK